MKATTNSKKANVEALKSANKECMTISGVCKIIRSFWKDGYKDAFKRFGLCYEDFATAPQILDLCQKNTDGKVFVTERRPIKDSDGKFVLKEDGKRKMCDVDIVVSRWSPSKLFKVLEQSERAL